MELEFRAPNGTLHEITMEANRDQTFSMVRDGQRVSGSWQRVGANTISLLTEDGRSHLVHAARDEAGLYHLHARGRTYRLVDPSNEEADAVGGAAAKAGGDINERGEILSPLPGKVVGLPVAEGDKVSAGDLLVILESMKMENPVLSPVSGTVVRLPLAVGDAAALGDPLIQLRADGGD